MRLYIEISFNARMNRSVNCRAGGVTGHSAAQRHVEARNSKGREAWRGEQGGKDALYNTDSMSGFHFKLVFLFFVIYYDLFYRLLSESDLCRSRELLLHLIAVNDTQAHILSRTSLDEGSARSRDLYLIINKTNNRQISIPPAGFETEIPASEGQQTSALDRAASEIGSFLLRHAYTSSVCIKVINV